MRSDKICLFRLIMPVWISHNEFILMLVIRKKQIEAFENAMLESFVDEMVEHVQEFSPRLCEVIGKQQVRIVVLESINNAGKYEFSHRGPVRLFIEMSFLFGSAFHNDPQYPWVSEVLNSDPPILQGESADQLYTRVLDYNEKVGGSNNAYTLNALQGVSAMARMSKHYSADNLVSELSVELQRIYPQKFHYTGEKALLALIKEGIHKARGYDFAAPREKALIVILMFAFGHGCLTDPLYPWIERTLEDQRITDPSARAKRLEKKALTWLDHVLAFGNNQDA